MYITFSIFSFLFLVFYFSLMVFFHKFGKLLFYNRFNGHNVKFEFGFLIYKGDWEDRIKNFPEMNQLAVFSFGVLIGLLPMFILSRNFSWYVNTIMVFFYFLYVFKDILEINKLTKKIKKNLINKNGI